MGNDGVSLAAHWFSAYSFVQGAAPGSRAHWRCSAAHLAMPSRGRAEGEVNALMFLPVDTLHSNSA